MGEYTPKLGFYKPGGGSTGIILPDEVADIDKINSNFDILDRVIGAKFIDSVAGYVDNIDGQTVYDKGTKTVHYFSAEEGALVTTASPVPAGVLTQFGGSSAPDGWLMCQGQSLQRSSYPALFAAIGTTYGSADALTFNLPDLRGRVPVGQLTSDPAFDVLGERGGVKDVTLTIAQMPTHSHPQNISAATGAGPAVRIDYFGDGTGQSYTQGISTGNTGGGNPHTNLQPYIVVNFIIKT